MKIINNPFLGTGLQDLDEHIPFPSCDAQKPADLLKHCPAFSSTPLVKSDDLAQKSGIASLYIKDERNRFGLGSFKALGAAYVIACDAVATGSLDYNNQKSNCLNGVTYVTASAGNHGMSVASGAQIFGANAVIFLAESVPESFAQRLRDKNATVVRHGQNYEESMQGALDAAAENGWTLLSDSSWPGYFDIPHRLMEGYLQLVQEAIEQLPEQPPQAPDHVFLQAGVGGFAGAVAALVRSRWGEKPIIVVVEPEAAPALGQSIKAGKPVVTSGPISSMGRLDCKEPSLIAFKGLARDANYFVTVSDQEVDSILPLLAKQGLATTPSGAAGLAALLLAQPRHKDLQLTDQSRVLAFITEGPE